MFQEILQGGGGGGRNIGSTYNEAILGIVNFSTKIKIVENSGTQEAVTIDFVAPKDEIYCFCINRYGNYRDFTSITINGESYTPKCLRTSNDNIDLLLVGVYLRKGDIVSAVTNTDSHKSARITAKVYI